MDEEQFTALEKDIRIVDEDIRNLKKRTEEIDREIAGTSDPERIKALQRRLDLIDQKENIFLQQKTILLQQKTILLQDRANVRDQCHASPTIVELVKGLEQDVRKQVKGLEEDVRKQFEEMRVQLASSSSSMASPSYPDKGRLVKASTARLHLPPPLIGEEAENMWPEGSWNSRARGSVEKDFLELVKELRSTASSPWNLKVTGKSSFFFYGSLIKPDVVIYKRPRSPEVGPVPLTTGVMLELKSGKDGLYNNDLRVGKAAYYGE